MSLTDFEFYETPDPFTRWLFDGEPIIAGRVAEVCVGGGAIVTAPTLLTRPSQRTWVTNDADPRWPADYHLDARDPMLYARIEHDHGLLDWVVSNPPFTPAIEIITEALRHVRFGVAMHLRASIHEVLKTGLRRTWMADHLPTGILWLPRFAYQRSKTTGKWTTDNMGACWVIWVAGPTVPQFIRYAPEWVIDELDQFTPTYRARMDQIMAARTT